MSHSVPLDFLSAAARISKVVKKTPLEVNASLSKRYNAHIFLKREDLQVVRSYKLRGAYNMLASLSKEVLAKGVVCASAGNHAQGFALSCKLLGTKGVIFMPSITPKQKIRQTKMWGEDSIEVTLVGDTFDDCAAAAQSYVATNGVTFIPPFDHPHIIEGQGTVGVEIMSDLPDVDAVFLPVGGGGLASGVGSYIKLLRPKTAIIGVEPLGAGSMKAALAAGGPVTLPSIDRFVDGAAVKRVGTLTYEICSKVLDDMLLVHEGKVCSTILSLYNEEAIVAEPAGALAIAALDQYAAENPSRVKGKKIVCIVSGSNNDIDRMQEIKERSLTYEGLKHYFLIRFPQRPGALRQFLNDVLGPTDDIVRFEYLQKNNRESGPALVGIEVSARENIDALIARMKKFGVEYSIISREDSLLSYLI
jgi:threonine dehydratase